MFDFKQYIIVVSATAIIGCIALTICGNKGSISAVIKLVVGIMMTLAILKPLIQIEIDNVAKYFSDVSNSASDTAQAGATWADSQSTSIIKEQIEAYILDKALSMGAHINAVVTLGDQMPFAPYAVTLSGNISPYIKHQLSIFIETDVGVKKENQIWIQ